MHKSPTNHTIAELRETTKPLQDEMQYEQWTRKISIYITWLALKTPINANGVTVVFLLVGLGGAFCFSIGIYKLNLLGAFLYIFALILDNVDGEVARARVTTSWKGGFLDWIATSIPDCFLFVGIALGSYRHFPFKIVLILGFVSSTFYWVTNSISTAYQRSVKDYVQKTGREAEEQDESMENNPVLKRYANPSIQRMTHDFRYLFLLPILTIFNLQVLLLPIYSVLYVASSTIKIIHYLSLDHEPKD